MKPTPSGWRRLSSGVFYGADYWADRSYGALDPEGRMWWITQRLRNPPA